MSKVRTIIYSTGNKFKIEEGKLIIGKHSAVAKGVGTLFKISDHFDFEFHRVPTDEPMECDVEKMVKEKAKSAYRRLLVPCIVEYAGLVFRDMTVQKFPGGLTQSIWTALGPARFISEVAGAGRPTIARAAVGYCDGMAVRTFVGETTGMISDRPRGNRSYDWDLIFCPDGEGGQTYAEVAEDPSKGLEHKVGISQSTKAFVDLFSYLIGTRPVHSFFP